MSLLTKKVPISKSLQMFLWGVMSFMLLFLPCVIWGGTIARKIFLSCSSPGCDAALGLGAIYLFLPVLIISVIIDLLLTALILFLRFKVLRGPFTLS